VVGRWKFRVAGCATSLGFEFSPFCVAWPIIARHEELTRDRTNMTRRLSSLEETLRERLGCKHEPWRRLGNTRAGARKTF